MTVIAIILAFAAAVISMTAGVLVLSFGHRLGGMDQPGSEKHKAHDRPTPNTGGVAIYWAIALPMAVILAAVWAPASWWDSVSLLRPIADHVAGLRSTWHVGAGVLAAMTVMHVLGLIDDRRNLGPFVKLGVQLVVFAALVLFCDMRVLELLDDKFGPAGWLLSALLSMVWLTVICNAMNFLDNMDGLAGGVGAIAAGLYLASTLIGGQYFVAALAALLVGALVGFLVYNFPPARFFMGDGGSLVLGLMLGVISIRTTYFVGPAVGDAVAPATDGASPGGWYGVLMPLMVLAVPLYDFTSVTLIRLWQGKSPFRGDQQHFSHRLVQRGLSRPAAVLVIWACTLATGLSGVMLSTLEGWQAGLAFAQTAAVLLVLALLERGAAKQKA